MDIQKYIDANGLLDIPAEVVAKADLDKLVKAIVDFRLALPTKAMLLGENRHMRMFRNLMEYRPEISTKPVDFPTTQWLVKTLDTNKYRGRYLSFVSGDADYENIDQLTDYFSETQRLSAKRIDKEASPMGYWQDKMADLVRQVVAEHKTISSNLLKERLWGLGLEANSFKLTLVSSIYWQFDAKRILDISAGWGDRLIGAIAHYAERYLGFDPNLALQSSHREIIETLTRDRTTSKGVNQYEVRYEPFEKAEIGAELFDLVLTSPPYFDLEIYTDQPGQSIISYPKFDDWLVYFLFQSLHKAWTHLKQQGNMVIHLSDYHKTHYVEAMVLFVLGWCENSTFDGVIGSIGTSGKPRPNWVFYKSVETNRKSTEQAQQNLKHYYPNIYRLVSKHF